MPIPFGSQADLGGKAMSVIALSIGGVLQTGAGTIRFPVWRPITVLNVTLQLGGTPTGASVIIDVNKNGTTIFTTQGNRPTVAAAATQDLASVPDVTAYAAGDYITVDVDQVGVAPNNGSDAVVLIEYE